MPEEGLVDLSTKCIPELDQALRQLVQLENCRSYREVIQYLLEVMLAVFKNNPGLRLATAPVKGDVRLTAQIRADIPKQLIDALTEEAREFCMDYNEIIRVYLQMALGFYKDLVSANEIPRKEELVCLIRAEYAYRKRLERVPFFLRRFASLFIRRQKR